jgi:hypothetical protein
MMVLYLRVLCVILWIIRICLWNRLLCDWGTRGGWCAVWVCWRMRWFLRGFFWISCILIEFIFHWGYFNLWCEQRRLFCYSIGFNERLFVFYNVAFVYGGGFWLIGWDLFFVNYYEVEFERYEGWVEEGMRMG